MFINKQVFSLSVSATKMKLTMLTRDLRSSERAREKCTYHTDDISREQSVFFRFELFCLKVDISSFLYMSQVCEASRLPYTLSFCEFMRPAPVHTPAPPCRDYLFSNIFTSYLLNPDNWLMKH